MCVCPRLPTYPHAKFPGVVVFSEIYQVTGPVLRFAEMIAAREYCNLHHLGFLYHGIKAETLIHQTAMS